jgi:hypothetical protein
MENDEIISKTIKKEEIKSIDDIKDEREIQMMKNFMNNLVQNNSIKKDNIIMRKNKEEANEARKFLDLKIPEIKNDINDQIEIQTRNLIKKVEKELSERNSAKGLKK